MPRSLRPARKMAGAGGFEPPDAGTKIRCLTTWRRPKKAVRATDETLIPRTFSRNGRDGRCGQPRKAPATREERRALRRRERLFGYTVTHG